MKVQSSSFNDIEAFVFDFDGVLTNNLVLFDSNGNEMVSCSRADGLAFDVLRKLKKPAYILSTEKNPVVAARAKKLGIASIQGISDKTESIKDLSRREGFALQKVMYVGNDLNDYLVMQLCGYSVCPADSHGAIKSIASLVLKTKGGYGVVRELLEDKLGLDFIEILYKTK